MYVAEGAPGYPSLRGVQKECVAIAGILPPCAAEISMADGTDVMNQARFSREVVTLRMPNYAR